MSRGPDSNAGAGLTTPLIVGLALRIVAAFAFEHAPSWDGVIYERAARLLADGHGFTHAMFWDHPTTSDGLPTAFYPPGWPATLSLVYRFGLGRTGALALQCLLGGWTIAGAGLLGARVADRRAAWIAAWIVALWPGGILLGCTWMGEILFASGLLLALLLLLAPRARGRMFGAALIFGALAYVRPIALVIAPLALGWAAWTDRARRIPARLMVWGAALLVTLACTAPWIARNVSELDTVAFTTSGAVNFYVGTQHDRFRRVAPDDDCPDGLRERDRERCFRERAAEELHAAPDRWLLRVPAKLAHTFGYEASPAMSVGLGRGLEVPERDPTVWVLVGFSTLFWWAVLLTALRSAMTASVRQSALLACPVAATAAIHIVFFGGDRYHLPLVPILAALAAPSWLAVLARIKNIEPEVSIRAPHVRPSDEKE